MGVDCVKLALLLVAFSTTLSADEKSFTRPREEYTHLLVERIVDTEINGRKRQDRQIAVQALPQGKAPHTVETARRVQSWNGRVLAIRRGVIFANAGIGEVHALDLATGQHLASFGKPIESFQLTSRPGEFLATGPYGFPIYRNSFEGDKRTILVKGPGKRIAILGRAHHRMAISPNGKLLATATYKNGDFSPVFEIHIVDLSVEPPTVKPYQQELSSSMVMTGGGDHAVAPPIFWADDSTLLVAPSIKRDAQGGFTVIDVADDADISKIATDGAIIVQGGQAKTPSHLLLQLDVATGEFTEVCKLMISDFMSSDPFGMAFWRRSDGAIMLRTVRSGDIRIDLEKREATAERKLSPHYEFKGDPYRPSLWFGDQQLTEKVFYRNVSVSPDGRCIAWLTPVNPANPNAFSSASSFPHALLYYSEDTGIVELAQGRFQNANSWGRFANPVTNPRFHWLTASDFESSDEFE